MIQRILQSSVTHVLFAFTVMGSWAIFANWQHPMPKPVVAGLVQGVLSGSITYFLKRTIEWLSAHFSKTNALWLPPLIACSASLCLLICVHFLMRTPEILRTIAVPFSVAAIYATIYNYLIWKLRGQINGE